MTFLRSRVICSIIVLIIFSGCAPKVLLPEDYFLEKVPVIAENNLWLLRIEQGKEEKFSGVLVLQQKNDNIDLVLLDPTGIKIMAEKITRTGEIQISSAIEKIKESRLPNYLGRAIHRIFYLNPDKSSCANKFGRLCWSDSQPDFFGKEATFGPFQRWSVKYWDYNKSLDTPLRIEHRAPWTDTTLFIQPLQ
jgi:hypothetical protein